MRRSNKKIAEIFKKDIPHIIDVKIKEGISFGYFRGTINGFLLGCDVSYLLMSAYCVGKNYCSSIFKNNWYWLPLIVIPVLLNAITPKEIRGKFDGKLMLFLGIIIVVFFLLVFVVF
jgi:hypothetical protein